MLRLTRIGLLGISILASGACAASDEDLADDVVPLTASLTAADRSERCDHDPRVQLGLVAHETCFGAELFFRETFDGNGRTCGSCHPAQNNFTIDADYIASLSRHDPLFVSELKPRLSELEIPELLHEHGLVRVNADGFDDLDHRFVMRSVSHTLSLATTVTPPPLVAGSDRTLDNTPIPPLHRTGWSGDGAPGEGDLLDFADGAIVQHATRSLARREGRDFRLTTPPERSAISAFMFKLGRQNDINLADVSLTDAAAERGRINFISGPARDCNTCHFGGGANSVVLSQDREIVFVNFSFEVGTERIRLPALADYNIPFDGGFGRGALDSDGDGVNDAFGTGAFNTPPLIEAPDTAPYFHANAAETLEDAIRFYTTPEFGTSLAGGAPSRTRPNGGPFAIDEVQIAELGRLLRVLNASFNCQQGLVRLDALTKIRAAYGARQRAVQRGLIELTRHELDDALRVLGAVEGLNAAAQESLQAAQCALTTALWSLRTERATADIARALELVQSANLALGQGMSFQIGEGTLMF